MNQVTIIKPEDGEGVYPAPEIRRIYPVNKLLIKFYLTSFVIWLIIGIGIMGLYTFISMISQFESSSSEPLLPPYVMNMFVALFWISSIVIIPPLIIILYIYVNSMEFIVHGDEIIVKKGVFNKTIKYCPFRTITNISTTAGPFDRLFGIGCVNIETAGKSATSNSPEEKLEGLPLFHEIRDYILNQLRTYDPSKSRGVTFEAFNDLQELKNETLNELKEIKQLLKKLKW